MVIIDTINGNIFLCFSFMLMAFLERMPWQRKCNNPFYTYMSGLTVKSYLQSQDRTHVWSMELIYQVLYGIGIMTGDQVWVCYWRNRFRARIVSCTPAQKSSVYLPTLRFPPFTDCATLVHSMRMTYGSRLQRLLSGKWQGNRRNKMDFVRVKSW